MKKSIKIISFSILLIAFNQLSAKHYHLLSSDKIKKKGFKFAIMQLDSEKDFSVIKTQEIGSGTRAKLFYSPKGNYVVTYLEKKKKESSQLIIHSIEDLNEIMRVDVGKFSSYYAGQKIAPLFNESESIIALQVIKGRKQNLINSYDIKSGKLLYSVSVEKKGMLLGQSKTKNTFYLGGKAAYKGYAGLYVHSITDGKLLEAYKENKVYYNYKQDLLPDLFVNEFSYNKVHEVTIMSLDPDTGKKLMKKKFGSKVPVFQKIEPEDDFLYVTNKSGYPSKINVYKFRDNKFELLINTESDINPFHLTVSHDGRKFVVASKSKMRLLDMDDSDNVIKINAPFDVATGFFSKDDSLVYLREGTGSEVGLIDFAEKKLIGDSGTGRASVKVGQFLATAAFAVATGAYSGYASIIYYKSDTAMLLSSDQEKLYVVNVKTNDVTIFNAKDLSGKKGVATGKNTYGVFQLKTDQTSKQFDDNVFVISPKKLSYFKTGSNKIDNQIKFKESLSFDFEENLFFIKSIENNLQVHELSSGKLIKNLQNVKNVDVISYYTSPK